MSEFDPKLASFPWLGLHIDSSVHTVDHLANQRKAYACALVALAKALEHLPNLIVIFRFDADAFVFNPNANKITAPFRGNGHLRDFSGNDELHGVSEEVGKTLRESSLITHYMRDVWINDDFGVRRLKLRIRLDDPADEGCRVNRTQFEFRSNHGAIAEGVGNEMVHSEGGLGNAAEQVTVLGFEGIGCLCQKYTTESSKGP